MAWLTSNRSAASERRGRPRESSSPQYRYWQPYFTGGARCKHVDRQMSEIHAGVYPRAQDIENAKAAPFGVSAASATDADAALIALEQQFNAISAELLALQQLCSDAEWRRSAERPPEPVHMEAYAQRQTHDKVGTDQIEAILTRLDPIERAIMATPACTIAGLGVKARHAAYVMSQYWEEPIGQIDWEAQAVRLLVEAVCDVAHTPLPF
jgi:hypothetical protein